MGERNEEMEKKQLGIFFSFSRCIQMKHVNCCGKVGMEGEMEIKLVREDRMKHLAWKNRIERKNGKE